MLSRSGSTSVPPPRCTGVVLLLLTSALGKLTMTSSQTLAVSPADAAPSAALASLSSLDRMLDRVDQLTDDMAEHVTGLRRRRAFDGGHWVAGFHAGGRLDPRLPFSRLEVRIDMLQRGARARLATVQTVKGRQARGGEVETPLDEPGWTTVDGFLENEFLAFAEAWYAAD